MTAVLSAHGASVAPMPLLVAIGPGARDYLIVPYAGGDAVSEFTTCGIGGRSADETAIANLLTWSQEHDGEYVVYFAPGRGHRPVALCAALGGVGRMLVEQDAASADSMYGTQLPVNERPHEREHWRSLAAARRALDAPWDKAV